MNKRISIKVHPNFYKKIERERREFMRKNGLDRLSTAAFTGILSKGGKNNVIRKKKKR